MRLGMQNSERLIENDQYSDKGGGVHQLVHH